MTRGRGRKSLYLVGFGAMLARSPAAWAQTPPSAPSAGDAKKACLAQHEAAQSFRRAGKLLEAREATLVCSREECPAVVRADCGEWLEVVTKAIPSVVLRVKLDDKDVFDVRVSLDGKPLTSHLDGTPVELNPGAHTLRFEYASFDPIEQQILVLEGEKNRVVAADFVKALPVSKEPVPKPEEAPAPIPTHRPIPVMTYVLGGVAVAGAAGFAVFGVSGQSKKKDLETTCRPVCTDEQLQPVHTQFLIADISLGVAIASTIAAGIVYFTRPALPIQGTAAPPAGMAFDFSPTATGGQLSMRGEF